MPGPFEYNTNVPFATNAPSQDQPDMLQNTRSINSLINIDHYSFNQSAKDGWHRQVTLPNKTIPTTALNQGALWTQLATSLGAGQESDLFYTQDSLGHAYQLTRTIDGAFSLFGLFTNNYGGAGTAYTGGWTFLAGPATPGALMLQYGLFNPGGFSPAISGNIPFPVQFNSAPFVVLPTLVAKVGGTNSLHVVSVVSGSITNSQFTWNVDNTTTGYTGIYWIAIGF